MPRQYTNKLYDMLDEGLIDKDLVITACLKYMSEDEVKDMMEANEFIQEEDEEEDEEETCEHYMNPGGYCIHCGWGRDHS